MNDNVMMTPQELSLMFQHYEVFDRYATCANELIQKMKDTAKAYQVKPTEEQKRNSEDDFFRYEENLEKLNKETFDYFNMVCHMMDSIRDMRIYGIPYPNNDVAIKEVSEEYRMKLRRLADITLKGYHHFVTLEVESIRSALIDNGTIEVKFEPHVLICSTIHSSNGRNVYGGIL